MALELCGIRLRLQEDLPRLIPYISPETAERIGKFVQRRDALGTALAEMLIKAFICRRLGRHHQDIHFARTSMGKPFWEDDGDLHFSISHSGGWVVAACDDHPVGIDIEEIKAADMGIARDLFAASEYARLQKAGDSRDRYFCALWVLKESYLKACGSGLGGADLRAIPFTIHSGGRAGADFPCARFFRLYEVDHSHRLAVCSHRSGFPSGLEVCTADELIGILEDSCR